MSHSEQIRHPGGALDPQPNGLPWWCWLIGGGIVALILIGIFRPAWFAKIGIHISGAGKALGNINPRGWV
jgi:hypothetical protein